MAAARCRRARGCAAYCRPGPGVGKAGGRTQIRGNLHHPPPSPGGDWPPAAGGWRGARLTAVSRPLGGSLSSRRHRRRRGRAPSPLTWEGGRNPPLGRCGGGRQAGAGAARCGRRGGGGRFLPLPGPDSSLGGGTGLAPRPARAAALPRPWERRQKARLCTARAPKARDPVSSGPDPPPFP